MFDNAIYLDDVPKEDWKNYIGNGYRSVCYTTDATRHGKIILFGFDKSGNRTTFICPWESHAAYNVKYETPYKDIYDNYVEIKHFNSKYERDNWIKSANGINVVECLKPESEFLHFMFDDVVLDDSFNKQPLRVQSIDIETEISDQFEKPADARNRINMITIHDSETDKYYTWSLEHAEIDFKEEPLCSYSKDMFVFYEFGNNESRMLEHFIGWIESNYPDVSYGWNIRGYDWPYIVRRIENTLGKNAAKRLSPVGKYFIKEVNHDNARADVAADIEVDIQGLFIADGLVLYRDKFGIAGNLDGGYKLDNVGEHEELGHKIHYEGSLKDLYLQDYQKFYEYNVRDVDLCKKINDKRKMIDLARQISSFGLVGYGAIYSSISYLIGSVIAFSKVEMGNKIFTSWLGERKQFDSFEGAFVFPTVKGIYRGGIGTIDFASLYPSNIRSINASPETFVGKVLVYRKTESGALTTKVYDSHDYVDGYEAKFNPFSDNDSRIDKTNASMSMINAGDPTIEKIELRQPNGKVIQLTIEQLRKLINEKCIWTANNTLFLKHEVKWGVIAKWCEHFYALRKATKKKELACYHKLHDKSLNLSEAEIKQLETDEVNYHTIQIGIKSMINSIYGCMGTSFSPIANPDIAQSVTRQGKLCNQSTSKFVLKRFKELYGVDDDYIVAVSGDTDSIFLNLECVSKHLIKKHNLPTRISDWEQKYRQELWDIVSSFVKNEVNPFVRNLVHAFCHTTQQDVLTYELEYMGDCGIYESKKHYFLHKIFEEGDAVDKNKVTGIELKKTQVPKQMKSFLSEIYEGVVNKYWSEADYNNYISELYDKFNHFSIDEVSFWKGYGTERQAIGFLQMANGTTGIAKACIYHN